MHITFLGMFSNLVKQKEIIRFIVTTKKYIHYFYLHLKKPRKNSMLGKEERVSVYNVFMAD